MMRPVHLSASCHHDVTAVTFVVEPQLRPSRRSAAMVGGPHQGGGRRGGRKGGRAPKKAPPLHKMNGLDLLHTQTLLSTNAQGEHTNGL